jgi:hypothetical protein
MSLLRIYLRGLGLPGPEKWLAPALGVANVALAMVFLTEPWLFGRVVDGLAAKAAADAWFCILGWGGLQQALAALVRGRTTFVIAHRLSTVRSADVILVLKDGQLVEQGRYEELVRLGGAFAQLDACGRFVADTTGESAEPLRDYGS